MVGSSFEVQSVLSHGSTVNGKSVAMQEMMTLAAEENSFDLTAVVEEPDLEVKEKEIVLGRNVHTTCLAVTEPDADDESTGDKEAHMASVLARYRKTLIERTRHHLG